MGYLYLFLIHISINTKGELYATLLLPHFLVRRHIEVIPVLTCISSAQRTALLHELCESSQPREQQRCKKRPTTSPRHIALRCVDRRRSLCYGKRLFAAHELKWIPVRIKLPFVQCEQSIGIDASRTHRAPTDLVSLQPIKCRDDDARDQ